MLTQCYDENGQHNGETGPLDPTQQSTFDFVGSLYKEIVSRFKDPLVHIGGDEVGFACWQSNPNVRAFMKARNWTDYARLESYYVQFVLDTVNKLGRTPLVWEEVFDNGVQLTPDTVVDVWKGGWNDTLARVTKAGYKAVLSSPWYLNYHRATHEDWTDYYLIEPTNFTGTAEQKARVVGGEACIWGEYVDETVSLSRLWPRAGAVAERLWSPKDVRDLDSALPRLRDFRCRMLVDGFPAEPFNGPSFCPVTWQHDRL